MVSVASLLIGLASAAYVYRENISPTATLIHSVAKNIVASGQCNVPGAAGTNGVNGTNGTPGLKGATGAKGEAGATGAKGDTGVCSLSTLQSVATNIVPAQDNFYSLGSPTYRWKDIQVGPGTIYIQDQTTGKQAGLSVEAGTLLVDGADSLRIGNSQLTATGLKSLDPNADITIGQLGDQGYLSTAHKVRKELLDHKEFRVRKELRSP